MPDIIAEGLTLFVGAPKLGKSWAVLDIALAVAAGGRALGAVVVDPGRVLYLGLEDSDRRLQTRAERLLGNLTDLPEAFDYLTAIRSPGDLLPTLDAWLTLHARDARLVIVDTLGRVMPQAPAGSSTYLHEYRVAAALKEMADRHEVALVVVHHERKAAALDFVDSVSGTNGLAGAADTVVVLSRARGENAGVLHVTGRDVDERDYALVSAGGCWQLTDAPPVDPSLADRANRILACVNEQAAGVKAADVAAALGISTDTTKRYLKRLADSGRIIRLERGTYAPVPSVPSVPPYIHGGRKGHA